MTFSNPFAKKPAETASSFEWITDMGTRRALESVAKIVVGSLAAYAFGKGWLTQSQSTDFVAKGVEILGYATVIYLSWRKAHRTEREIAVANALPAGTSRQEIRDTAMHPDLKDVAPEDIASMLPPPSPPMGGHSASR